MKMMKRVTACWLMLSVLFLTIAGCGAKNTNLATETSEETDSASGSKALFGSFQDLEIQAGEELLPQTYAEETAYEGTRVASSNFDSVDSAHQLTILQIIPHEKMSVFPYMIDWAAMNTEMTVREAWDTTVLGYDGLFSNAAAGRTGFDFAYIDTKNATYPYYLGKSKENYDVTLLDRDNDGVINRIYYSGTNEEKVESAAGYFMYVGEVGTLELNPKGLFCLNENSSLLPTPITSASPELLISSDGKDNYGIRYRVEVVPRTKDTNPADENLGVVDPVYFHDSLKGVDNWQREYIASNNGSGEGVKSRTDYNYVVSFSPAQNNSETGYTISYLNDVKSGGSSVLNKDYLAYLNNTEQAFASEFERDYGYEYYEGGNYSASAKIAGKNFGQYKGSSTDTNAYYVKSGSHYKMIDQNTENISDDEALYTLTFSKVKAGSGDYILSRTGVKAEIEDSSSDPALEIYNQILFEYVGKKEGKDQGIYHVDFTFSAKAGNAISKSGYAGARYEAVIEEVTEKDQGRFCLVCASGDVEIGPEYSSMAELESGRDLSPTDYEGVISYIDYKGLNYYTNSADQWNSDYGDGKFVGICNGCVTSEHTERGEKGEWVFYPYAENDTHGTTTVNQYKEMRDRQGGFEFGDKIYVDAEQKRRANTYRLPELINNDWFKLLMYLDDPDNFDKYADDQDKPDVALAYYAYQNKTASNNVKGETKTFSSGKEIKEYYKTELDNFNKNYGIEVISRPPHLVDLATVQKADLIYIVSQPADTTVWISDDGWNGCMERRGEDYKKYKISNISTYSESGEDFSSIAISYEIYKRCIVNRECGIIFQHKNGLAFGQKQTSNLDKLLMMLGVMDQAIDFTKFLPWLADENGNYYCYDEYSKSLLGEGQSLYTEVKEDGTVYAYKNNEGLYNLGKTYLPFHSYDTNVGNPISAEDGGTNGWIREYFQIPYVSCSEWIPAQGHIEILSEWQEGATRVVDAPAQNLDHEPWYIAEQVHYELWIEDVPGYYADLGTVPSDGTNRDRLYSQIPNNKVEDKIYAWTPNGLSPGYGDKIAANWSSRSIGKPYPFELYNAMSYQKVLSTATQIGASRVRWYAEYEDTLNESTGLTEKKLRKWSDTYLLPWNGADAWWDSDATINVYRLFHPNQKANKGFTPVVTVLNADDVNTVGAETVYYFYVDSFAALDSTATAFNVIYQVTADDLSTPTSTATVTYTAVVDGKDRASKKTDQQYKKPAPYDTLPGVNSGVSDTVYNDFVSGGILRDGISSRDYKITATDNVNNNSGYAIVRFVVRDSFMLN